MRGIESHFDTMSARLFHASYPQNSCCKIGRHPDQSKLHLSVGALVKVSDTVWPAFKPFKDKVGELTEMFQLPGMGPQPLVVFKVKFGSVTETARANMQSMLERQYMQTMEHIIPSFDDGELVLILAHHLIPSSQGDEPSHIGAVAEQEKLAHIRTPSDECYEVFDVNAPATLAACHAMACAERRSAERRSAPRRWPSHGGLCLRAAPAQEHAQRAAPAQEHAQRAAPAQEHAQRAAPAQKRGVLAQEDVAKLKLEKSVARATRVKCLQFKRKTDNKTRKALERAQKLTDSHAKAAKPAASAPPLHTTDMAADVALLLSLKS